MPCSDQVSGLVVGRGRTCGSAPFLVRQASIDSPALRRSTTGARPLAHDPIEAFFSFTSCFLGVRAAALLSNTDVNVCEERDEANCLSEGDEQVWISPRWGCEGGGSSICFCACFCLGVCAPEDVAGPGELDEKGGGITRACACPS